ncbi:MAG: DUF883 family protein [Verrucomicrobiae bacterium]|nr:DUF883 family protein [Verrucomicrobiae bacterium]NNJ43448.1 DUF883 family protein [Akkermansiaceae bacterium]
MEETYADPKFTTDSPFSETPASQQAANDLRAAAGEKAKEIAQDASNKAKQIKQTAVDKAQQFRDFAGNKASDIKNTAGVKAQQIKQVAGEQVQNGRVKARAAHADTEEYIRQHPTKSVLTALGIGFVIGLVIRR